MGSGAPPSTLKGDIALLRELLLTDARASGVRKFRPKLLMLAGLPGAGKSTFAARLNSQFPFVTLETDRLRKALVSSPLYTPEEHSRVFRACHWLIDEFVGHGLPVLFDATNLTEKNRKPVYRIARKRGVPLAVAVITAPSDLARRRLEDREAGLDLDTWSDAGWQIHSRMSVAWEPVKRPHFLVDTSADITPALNEVLEWARS